MKTVVIIQARMQSSRLPGKVLLPLPTGRSVLAEVVSRVKRIKGIDQVVVAIPDTKVDTVLIPHIERAGVTYFSGPHEDVLARYWYAARAVGAERIMRITADCPLLEPTVCDGVLTEMEYEEDGRLPDYASNCFPRTFPKGWDCEVFSWEALDFAHRNAGTAYDREHVTSFLYAGWFRPHFSVRNLANRDGEDWSAYNFSLDTLDDYYRICVEMQHQLERQNRPRRVIQ